MMVKEFDPVTPPLPGFLFSLNDLFFTKQKKFINPIFYTESEEPETSLEVYLRIDGGYGTQGTFP